MSAMMPGSVVDALNKHMISGAKPDELGAARVVNEMTSKDTDINKSTTEKMTAVEYNGKRSVAVNEARPKPLVTDECDAVIRVTTAGLCGTDLHIYNGFVAGMSSGDVLGPEVIGIVDQVGPTVKNFKVGDRVVVACILACGKCWYCEHQLFSSCDITNPSAVQETQYGARMEACWGLATLLARTLVGKPSLFACLLRT
jgi:hypothetical protein